MYFMYYFFFFFKQKTAYEMRISDWSSDVCSSDLHVAQPRVLRQLHHLFGQLRRDEQHAAVAAQHDIAGHGGRLADADRAVDAHHRRIEPRARRHRAEMVRRVVGADEGNEVRSEEHTSELQSLMRISYAVFCLKKKTKKSIELTK